MKNLRLFLIGATLALCLEGQTPVVINSLSSFAVLGGSTVTNTGPSVVNGNLGVFAGTAVTGFPPGSVIGGAIHAADGVASTAQGDLTTAFLDASGRPCPGSNVLAGDIGGATLMPGVYCSGPTMSLGITGTLTLNGNGNSGSVFIIQVASTLITATGNSVVNLTNGAQAANVFWVVGSSATLGTNTVFNGTILAQASVTLTSGAVLNGRALGRVGAVTLANNAVTNPGPPVAAGAPLSSLTCAFTSGQVGQLYISSLVATGGLSPYTYSISVGSLPPGLTLNPSTGVITGTPTTIGTFSYTARVQDSAAAVLTTSCGGITITAAQLPATPAPSSLILLTTALACLGAYQSRQRLLRR